MDYEEMMLQITDVLKAHNRYRLGDFEQAVKLIREIVTPKGKWELYQYQESRKKDWYCTACATIVKNPLEKKYSYCPNCGADMRGDENA